MKILKALVLVTATMLFFGCATPLTIQSDGKCLAPKIGVGHESIRFLSYCNFAKIPKPKTLKYKIPKSKIPKFTTHNTVVGARGIIMVTQSKLYLLKGTPSEISNSGKIDIPFSRIQAVDMRKSGGSRQIQLLVGNDLIVLNIIRYNMRCDKVGSEYLCNYLYESGVSKWESKELFGMAIPPSDAEVSGELLLVILQVIASFPLLPIL